MAQQLLEHWTRCYDDSTLSAVGLGQIGKCPGGSSAMTVAPHDVVKQIHRRT